MRKLVLTLGVLMILLMGCQNKENSAQAGNGSDLSKKATYTITVSGIIEKSGFISFGGYDMNVYEDQSSNPCGDCERQPTHLYKGADTKAVVESMKNSVEKENYLWDVQDSTDTTITLVEKESGQTKDPGTPESVKGLTITGVYKSAK